MPSLCQPSVIWHGAVVPIRLPFRSYTYTLLKMWNIHSWMKWMTVLKVKLTWLCVLYDDDGYTDKSLFIVHETWNKTINNIRVDRHKQTGGLSVHVCVRPTYTTQFVRKPWYSKIIVVADQWTHFLVYKYLQFILYMLHRGTWFNSALTQIGHKYIVVTTYHNVIFY